MDTLSLLVGRLPLDTSENALLGELGFSALCLLADGGRSVEEPLLPELHSSAASAQTSAVAMSAGFLLNFFGAGSCDTRTFKASGNGSGDKFSTGEQTLRTVVVLRTFSSPLSKAFIVIKIFDLEVRWRMIVTQKPCLPMKFGSSEVKQQGSSSQ